MIDMIRLRTFLNRSEVDTLLGLLPYKGQEGHSVWQSFKYADYRYNYSISADLGGSYYVGIGHNREKAVETLKWNKVSLIMEYNPNKVKFGSREGLLMGFFMRNGIEVMSMDWAVDYDGISTSDVVVDKKKKATSTKMCFRGTNPTYYYGKGHGRIKVYDKARELGLDDSVIRTRIEISLSVGLGYDDLLSYETTKYPLDMYLHCGRVNLSHVPVVDRCVLICLMNGDIELAELSKNIRSRFKKYLVGICSDKLDLGLDTIGFELKSYIDNCLGFYRDEKFLLDE